MTCVTSACDKGTVGQLRIFLTEMDNPAFWLQIRWL